MTVSLVIPHWNNRPLIERALATLADVRAPEGGAVEIIVVDNGSTDGSADAAERAGARVIRLESNAGVGAALNRGISAARGEYVALLNNDVELAPDWIELLCGALATHPDAWFATGKTVSFGDRTRIDGAGDAICRGGVAWRLGHGRPDGPLFDHPRRTYFPSATAVLFRREFFEQVGLFEESFFAYLEDVDLGLRAALEDRGGLYVAEAVAAHRGSETTGPWSDAMVHWITCHQLLLLAKFYPAGLLLRFARPILAAQLLWAAMAVSHGRLGAWWAGLREGASRAGEIRRGSETLRRGRRLGGILRCAETEIVRIQRATGWDRYWKWYCRLAWPPAEEGA